MAVAKTFLVALVGRLAKATSDEEAIDVTHGNPPRAREGWCGELLILNERYCRDYCLAGDEVPASGSGPSSRAPHVAGLESVQHPAG